MHFWLYLRDVFGCDSFEMKTRSAKRKGNPEDDVVLC